MIPVSFRPDEPSLYLPGGGAAKTNNPATSCASWPHPSTYISGIFREEGHISEPATRTVHYIYIYKYMYYASFEVLFAVTCTGPDTTRYHVGPRNRRFLSVRPGPGAHEGLLTDTGNPLRPGPWSLSPGTHWQIGNLRSTSSQIPAAAFRTPPPSPLLKEWAEATDPKQGDSPLNNHRNHLLGAGCCPFRDLGQARLES